MRQTRLARWLAAASLLLAGCSLSEDITPPPNSIPINAGSTAAVSAAGAADGAALYAQHCLPCHGASGKGDGPLSGQVMSQRSALLPDFSTPAWQLAHSPADLLQIVTDGRLDQLMPPFRNTLSDSERQAVVAFIQTLAMAPNSASPSASAPTGPTPSAAAPGPSATPALAGQGGGAITGQVVNGTRGASVPAGQVIVLSGYDSFSQVMALTTTTGADGQFSFDAVPLAAGRQFLASTDFGGLTYSTDLVNLDGKSAVNDVQLTVFGVTTDPSVIQVEQMHISMSRDPNAGMVDVAEMFVVSNSGDKVYLPASGPVLEIPLPAGTTAVNLDSQRQGLDLTQAAQSVRLNSPIRPGQSALQFSFSFQLPSADPLPFEQKLGYGVKALNVLLPSTNVTAQSAQLQDAGTQTIASGRLRAYTAQNLASGEVVAFKVEGLGSGSSPSLSGLALPVFSLLLVAVAAVGGAVLWRRRRAPATVSQRRVDDLIQAIADLDDAHDAGRLDTQPYQAQRARLKQELLELMASRTDRGAQSRS